MDALDAGQSKGGDTRGMQSAGILVVRPLAPNSTNTVERVVDMRVDDHENPFKEFRRLLNMTLGVPSRLTESADKLAGEGKFTEAIAELNKALEINPRSEDVHYALAQRYAQAGDAENALKWLGTAICRQPAVWKPRAAEDPLFEKLRDPRGFQEAVVSATISKRHRICDAPDAQAEDHEMERMVMTIVCLSGAAPRIGAAPRRGGGGQRPPR